MNDTDRQKLKKRLRTVCERAGVVIGGSHNALTLSHGFGPPQANLLDMLYGCCNEFSEREGGLEGWLRENLPAAGPMDLPVLEVSQYLLVCYAEWSVEDGTGMREPITHDAHGVCEIIARAEAAIQAVEWLLEKRKDDD